MFSKFFVWQELIWLHHFVSYEYFRIMIWHRLNFEHFKNLENLEDLENLKNLDNWVFWTYWELTCSFRSILSSDLGLNSFESCFYSWKFLSKTTCKEVPRWAIFMEQNMKFRPVFGWAAKYATFEVNFYVFTRNLFFIFYKNTHIVALKSCLT